MTDPNLLQVIKAWEEAEPVPLSAVEREDLAQRLHDAGYRKVPSMEDIAYEIVGYYGEHPENLTDEEMLIGPKSVAQAIQDLMMGGAS